MILRTLWLMVAKKISKLRGSQVAEVHYLTLYAKIKFQTNACFPKQKGQQLQIWKFDKPVKHFFPECL